VLCAAGEFLVIQIELERGLAPRRELWLNARRPAARRRREREAMHKNPKFWALTAALFILLCLAVVNIVEKISMLLHLSENGG
jgi:hypothetical protein